MNPYDFVPIDRQHPPERRRAIWHHVLKNAETDVGKLYSGRLYVTIKTETPLFIRDTGTTLQDPDNPGAHMYNNAGKYIIPGPSLKGLLRNVVETLCNGCLRMFHLPMGYEQRSIPQDFAGCQDNRKLCLACRIFGMMQEIQRNSQVFLGKINIGDALAREGSLALHEPIYTAVLDAPKPRHQAFYLDADRRYIAGRKFYFHHSGRLNTEDRLLPIRNEPGRFRNQYIEPIDTETEFNTSIDFAHLEADEFAALFLAILLGPGMRHKIGYGKPIGLGSVQLSITTLQLVDYSQRYKNIRTNRGIVQYEGESLTDLLKKQMAPLDEQIKAAWQRFSAQPALQHLHRIWQWPPDESVAYAYPSQRWFKENPRAPIEATKNLYPGD